MQKVYIRGNNAVIYLRVSTPGQAQDALNLENQEKLCRAYCQQRGLNVVRVFIDAGESARSCDRPEFQKMLAFCKNSRNAVQFVVVQDLSRFARNNMDQLEAIYSLSRSGVRLRSAYESNIDETAAGKLATNMFGAFNQFFSDAHSEKQRDRKRAAILAGRVPWRAALGYINVFSKSGANIVPDPERAPLILEGFRLIGIEGYSKIAALETITQKGLTTRDGKPVSAQSFDEILVNPIYAGWVTLRSDPELEPVRGLHKAIVPQELFDRVQAILTGKKVKTSHRKKFNPDFPLRNLTHCAHCGKPLTGAFCKRIYPRYWCCNSECDDRAAASKDEFESQFQVFLQQARPTDEVAAQLPSIAARVWETKQADLQHEAKILSGQLEEKEQEKIELVRMRSRKELSPDEFEMAKTACALEISNIKEEILRLEECGAASESFVRFAQLQITDLTHVWTVAKPEQRQLVQNLLFEGGLDYSRKSGFLNRSKSSLFSALRSIDLTNPNLVGAAGFEPATSTV
jgi:site-specific DNA recombinase